MWLCTSSSCLLTDLLLVWFEVPSFEVLSVVEFGERNCQVCGCLATATMWLCTSWKMGLSACDVCVRCSCCWSDGEVIVIGFGMESCRGNSCVLKRNDNDLLVDDDWSGVEHGGL